MIQGGGFTPDMAEKKEGLRPPIKNEWQNGLKNTRGTIAMARTQVADSATAQFFINVVDNARPGHAARRRRLRRVRQGRRRHGHGGQDPRHAGPGRPQAADGRWRRRAGRHQVGQARTMEELKPTAKRPNGRPPQAKAARSRRRRM